MTDLAMASPRRHGESSGGPGLAVLVGPAHPDTAGGRAGEDLGSLLAAAADTHTDGLRFVDRHEHSELHPWSQIVHGAAGVAGRLVAAGVGPGDRVALVYATEPAFFAAFFGSLLAGAVPVPLYPPARLGRLAEYHRRTAALLAAAEAVLVLTSPLVRRLLGEAVALARPRLGCLTLDELPPAPPLAARALPADSLGLVQFSSGTTVEPKPVALTHRALVAQTRALSACWADTPTRRHSGVSWLPLYHDMGLIGCVFPALARRADLTLLGPELFVARPALWLRAIGRYRATISPAPNFAYGLCVQKVRDEELTGVDLSCWEAALNGAEPVAPAVLRAFTARFARWGLRAEALTPVYGLSEAALAVTFSDLGQPFQVARFDRHRLACGDQVMPRDEGREVASVGRPLAGFTVTIRDEEGAVVAPGVVGRVVVRGPSLMVGYLGNPEATARSLVDGWLDTGDLGFVRDGELYLTGRAKDVLILRGRNYSPEEVEQVASGVAGVRPGAVAAASTAVGDLRRRLAGPPDAHPPARPGPLLRDQPRVAEDAPGGEQGQPPDAEGRGIEEGSERLVVWVETRRDSGNAAPGSADLALRVRQAVLEATGLAVDHVEVLATGTLPRTSSGKIRRGETLRSWLAGELHPPAEVGPLRLLAAMTRSALALRRARPRPSE